MEADENDVVAPKKAKGQKLDLSTFMQDSSMLIKKMMPGPLKADVSRSVGIMGR